MPCARNALPVLIYRVNGIKNYRVHNSTRFRPHFVVLTQNQRESEFVQTRHISNRRPHANVRFYAETGEDGQVL